MPRCHIGDQPLNGLLDRYGARIEARVTETEGNRFDVALTVEGFEIACLRLRGCQPPVMTYTDHEDQPAALGRSGNPHPLP